MTRTLLLLTFLLTLFTAPTLAAERPNIIFIFTDDHASHAISAYSSKINKTPNIDRIAKDGMRFDYCLVTNSICGPSRATILTGKYSHENGFYRNGNNFDGSQWTFPKQLQKAGYQTAMIGKWHLSSDPTGFDYWEVLYGQGPYYNPPMKKNGERVNYTGYTTDVERRGAEHDAAFEHDDRFLAALGNAHEFTPIAHAFKVHADNARVGILDKVGEKIAFVNVGSVAVADGFGHAEVFFGGKVHDGAAGRAAL